MPQAHLLCFLSSSQHQFGSFHGGTELEAKTLVFHLPIAARMPLLSEKGNTSAHA